MDDVTPFESDIFGRRLRRMIYVKSFLAGIAATIMCWVLCSIIVMELLVRKLPTPQFASIPANVGSQADGYGYMSSSSSSPLIPMWPFVIGALVIFAAVSYRTFKKFSKEVQHPG
jgi:hypothetical protein